MLALSRRPGETIRIGDDVVIKIVGIKGNQVRISIEAPPDVTILRSEVYERDFSRRERERGNQD